MSSDLDTSTVARATSRDGDLAGAAIAASTLRRTFKGGVEAVRDIDLSVSTGEIFGFLGPNGAGKTPTVLFLDEPTTGLDPASRLTVWDEVRRINSEGTTVFLTTQYLEEADKLCDRVAIIDDGQIVAQGTPAQLKADMGHDVVSVAL